MYHARHLVKELKSRVVDVNLSHTLQTAETQYSREQLSGLLICLKLFYHDLSFYFQRFADVLFSISCSEFMIKFSQYELK